MSGRTKVAVGAIGAMAAQAGYGAACGRCCATTSGAHGRRPRAAAAPLPPGRRDDVPRRALLGRTYRGRDEVEAFLRRFLDAGLRGELGAIWVGGPPWATRIALEFDDHAHDRDTGERIYDNRAVLVLRTRLGRVVREEVYEDTQKVAAFDAALAARDGGARTGAGRSPHDRRRRHPPAGVKAIHIMAAFAAFGLPFAYPALIPYVRRRHPQALAAASTTRSTASASGSPARAPSRSSPPASTWRPRSTSGTSPTSRRA